MREKTEKIIYWYSETCNRLGRSIVKANQRLQQIRDNEDEEYQGIVDILYRTVLNMSDNILLLYGYFNLIYKEYK